MLTLRYESVVTNDAQVTQMLWRFIFIYFPEIVRIDMAAANVTVDHSSTVYLLCVVYGYPIPASVSWQFNGTSITNYTSCRVNQIDALWQSWMLYIDFK